MANRRLELHEVLCELLGSRNVYFQPPESLKMSYPAIVYSLDDIHKRSANDGTYLSHKLYQVTLVGKDPDSALIDELASLPTCKYEQHYAKDNLNHDVFTLYY